MPDNVTYVLSLYTGRVYKLVNSSPNSLKFGGWVYSSEAEYLEQEEADKDA